MKYFYSAAAFILFAFFSCKSETDAKEQLVAPSATPLTTNPVFSANNDSAALKAGVKLNPKHGQPGHDCNIAEGAPLNVPATSIQPNASAIQPTTSSSTSTNTKTDAQKVSPQANTSATALNPKHGDPGHRCDIAVGAPLNSKPTQ